MVMARTELINFMFSFAFYLSGLYFEFHHPVKMKVGSGYGLIKCGHWQSQQPDRQTAKH